MNYAETALDTLKQDYEAKNFDGYFQAERHEMLNYIPQTATTILDIGCASGSFGQLLKQERSKQEQVLEIWGIEPTATAAQIATQRLDRVICDTFSSHLDLPHQYFDCIIFNDVLEHLVDPYAALNLCHRLLSDRGVIVASIPNVRYFDNIWNLMVLKKWEYTDWGILDKTHLRFFTHRSIEQTFTRAGYCIEQLEGINPLEKVHPHHLQRFKLFNWLFPKRVGDMRYLQFAVVARSTTAGIHHA